MMKNKYTFSIVKSQVIFIHITYMIAYRIIDETDMRWRDNLLNYGSHQKKI